MWDKFIWKITEARFISPLELVKSGGRQHALAKVYDLDTRVRTSYQRNGRVNNRAL